MSRPISQRLPTLRTFNRRINPSRRFLATTQLRSQQLPGEDGRTTHFGFETVAETQKEAKGKDLLPCHPRLILTFISWRSLFVCGILV